MHFFLSNIDIHFDRKEFIWRIYTTVKAILIVKQVELINKHEFAKVGLNANFKPFIIHVGIVKAITMMLIYFF